MKAVAGTCFGGAGACSLRGDLRDSRRLAQLARPFIGIKTCRGTCLGGAGAAAHAGTCWRQALQAAQAIRDEGMSGKCLGWRWRRSSRGICWRRRCRPRRPSGMKAGGHDVLAALAPQLTGDLLAQALQVCARPSGMKAGGQTSWRRWHRSSRGICWRKRCELRWPSRMKAGGQTCLAALAPQLTGDLLGTGAASCARHRE